MFFHPWGKLIPLPPVCQKIFSKIDFCVPEDLPWDAMRVILSLLGIILFSPLATANEGKGFAIAQKIDRANRGFGGEVAETKMILFDAQKQQVERMMTTQVMEKANGEDRSLFEFLIPLDIKGTKILSWKKNYPDDNDQWLYLPSFRRVKRIQGGQRTGSFMGSEFSYEDIGGHSLESFTYKLLSQEKGKSWTLELVPKKTSGYSKKVVTYSATYMNAIKIDYYDRRGELKKTSTASDWKQYTVGEKKIWRANRVEMKNLKNRKETHMIVLSRKLGVTLRSKDFKKTSLK